MAYDKEIKIAKLREIITAIFDHIENDLQIKSIDVEHDYYNDVSLDETFEMLDKAPETVVGQLYEDLEFLEDLLDKPEERVSLMFLHVVPILKYLAYRIGQ